ncbi:MAG: ERCC4 domain-containing protein [Pseudomonadota bacterium]
MIILIDTREQSPLTFPPSVGIFTQRVALPTGDYSLGGFAQRVAVERKSCADAIASVRSGRKRFAREWERMAEIVAAGGFAAVLIECSRDAFVGACEARGKEAAGVLGTYKSWSDRHNVPVVFAPGRQAAAAWLVDFLREAHEELSSAMAPEEPPSCQSNFSRRKPPGGVIGR